jgi:hypothetical protein
LQTFLPYADYSASAAVLDNKRLNKQALEAWQILMTLTALDPAGDYREPKGWRNHPAVLLWRGHESALLDYTGAMVTEWISRGYKSTIFDKAQRTYETAMLRGVVSDNQPAEQPAWACDPTFLDRFTSSHRTALLAKNYDWYKQFGWPEDTGSAPATYEYIWSQEGN